MRETLRMFLEDRTSACVLAAVPSSAGKKGLPLPLCGGFPFGLRCFGRYSTPSIRLVDSSPRVRAGTASGREGAM